MPSTRCMRCSLSGRFATSKLTNLLRPVNSELAGGQERSRQLCLSRYERAVLTDAVVLRALERSRSCASPQQQAVFEGAFPPSRPATHSLHYAHLQNPTFTPCSVFLESPCAARGILSSLRLHVCAVRAWDVADSIPPQAVISVLPTIEEISWKLSHLITPVLWHPSVVELC